jgi:DNA-binding transcriptional LysR family regulator
MQQLDLNHLATFVRVARHGTFAAAAREEGVPTSTVSRRVARLEADLGIALLRRSGRSSTLSDDGRILFERATAALSEIQVLVRELQGAAAEGRLTVTLPIDLAVSEPMAELLRDFRAAHPAITLELVVTNRPSDLLREGIDVALRMHTRALASRDDQVGRTVLRGRLALYTAPAVAAALGETPAREEIERVGVLTHAVARASWAGEPAVVADDFTPLLRLACVGAGVALLPDFLAGAAVGRGQLVPVEVQDFPTEDFRLSVIWLRTRHLTGRVRAFVDHLAAATW